MNAAEQASAVQAAILLVDDRPENLLALEAILEPLGHRLVRALSGEEALRHVLTEDFAVILLDVQMPGMNGFEAAQLIKARERSKHIPIIFLTAISKEEKYVFEGYSAGAVDYMFKPFDPEILCSKVGVFVELHLKTLQLQRQSEQLRDSEQREMELRHHTQLREWEARSAEIVNSAIDAIVTFGDDHRIILFNMAAEWIFGRAARDTMGRPVEELLEPDSGTELVETLCTEAAGSDNGAAHPPSRRETLGRRADGTLFPIELSISCLVLPEERLFTLIGRDITERQQAEAALRDRQAALEHAMTARSRFYANMSHELRTPINAILGYTALLMDNIYGPLNDRQMNGIERTNKAAHHLLELVNDVLDLAKIEAGKIELQVEQVAFPELIEDLFVTVTPYAERYATELDREHRGDACTIVSDPRRVRQILLNLLSNAIKFGAGLPVRVVSEAREDGGIAVRVTDRGAGIAPEDQAKIFEEFVQLEQEPGKTQEDGTGLGLPISRRLAVLLGGSLEMESAPGEGSTFCLTLPPDLDQSRAAEQTRSEQAA